VCEAALVAHWTAASPVARLGGHHLSGLLHLAAALAAVAESAQDGFFWLEALLTHMQAGDNVLSAPAALQDGVGVLLMLLRNTNAELYDHLTAEGVSPFAWAPRYLACLLANVLPRGNLLEVWDVYFANGDLSLHPYVCLAVLSHCTEELVELDGDGAVAVMAELPRFASMAPILQAAAKLREEVHFRKIL
jgi:hypothetical protein